LIDLFCADATVLPESKFLPSAARASDCTEHHESNNLHVQALPTALNMRTQHYSLQTDCKYHYFKF